MTDSDPNRCRRPMLPSSLLDYAENLLLGTELSVEDALRIASADLEAPASERVAETALRAGWRLAEDLE
jgi:hypothetical protein